MSSFLRGLNARGKLKIKSKNTINSDETLDTPVRLKKPPEKPRRNLLKIASFFKGLL